MKSLFIKYIMLASLALIVASTLFKPATAAIMGDNIAWYIPPSNTSTPVSALEGIWYGKITTNKGEESLIIQINADGYAQYNYTDKNEEQHYQVQDQVGMFFEYMPSKTSISKHKVTLLQKTATSLYMEREDSFESMSGGYFNQSNSTLRFFVQLNANGGLDIGYDETYESNMRDDGGFSGTSEAGSDYTIGRGTLSKFVKK